MLTAETHHVSLPEGYAIVERLGAGGYGEVWKATAPGGVEKAVKLVFGHCNDGMAERERKALERIKSVRHPFILSVERHEVVDSRLVIVTELADMSLQDEFQRCQAEGLNGIPREKLVSYLWDAAEALDFLVERHELQHLDIKPENLLIVGDHAKVADFGLVKQIATQTLNSMMGGITPLYSAPEIFDDNPSPRSDQYSLAIVYQHLLTGSLPFPGRTPAQLAKQHTLAKPNLRPLSPQDRPIVAKTLSKDPAERFSTCREFISALKSIDPTDLGSIQSAGGDLHARQTPLAKNDTQPAAELETASINSGPGDAATRVLSRAGQQIDRADEEEATVPQASGPMPFPEVDSTVEDVDFPEIALEACSESAATLFIGVGGVGVRLLRAICTRAEQTGRAAKNPLAWLAIDTDRESLQAEHPINDGDPLPSGSTLHIPLRRPKQYRESSQHLLQWVSRRWLYNIPRSLQTRGFRPLGRIAAVDHADEILAAIQSRLLSISQQTTDPASKLPMRAVILAGVSGGTGSGSLIDIAQAVRSICRATSIDVAVQGVLTCTYELGSADSLAAANMYSLLTEINHAQLHGNTGAATPPGVASHFESPSRPFDEVFAVSLAKQGTAESEAKLQSVADYLLLQTDRETSQLFDVSRSIMEDSAAPFALQTFECVDLEQAAGKLSSREQAQAIDAVAADWLQESPSPTPELARLFGDHANTKFAHLAIDQYLAALDDDLRAEDSTPTPEKKIRADFKRIGAALSDFLQNLPAIGGRLEPTAPDDQAVAVSKRTVADFVSGVRTEKHNGVSLGPKLLETLLKVRADDAAEPLSTGVQQVAATVLAQTATGPLECGFQRRSVLLVPAGEDASEFLGAFQGVTPCRADVDSGFLIRVGSGLKPLDLAARLAETYPDVDEAASRLHARCDINWRSLRDSAVNANC